MKSFRSNQVYTGLRPGAGTKSRIAFVLAGDLADTGVRELSDGVRKQWLSVENGQTECILPVAAVDDLSTFKNRFYSHAKRSLSDSHMWVSVFYRPNISSFTRAQRASCVLVFIMLNMISSAMYYNPGENYQTEDGIEIGPIRFKLHQIYISVVCALIATPATIAVITLFKSSRRRYRHKKKVHNKSDRSLKSRIPFLNAWLEKRREESWELEEHLIVRGLPRFEGFWLPSWTVYIAWILVVLSTIVPAFFTMLFSMQWGKQKSEEWLTTFLLSFIESLFCLDPVKVLLMACILALLVRVLKEKEMPPDRAAVLRGYARCRIKHIEFRRPAPPLDEDSLRNAQDIRQKELLMKAAIQDVVINLVYIWILFSITFSNRDDTSYSLRQNIENRILAPKHKELPKFREINSTADLFTWLNKTALPSLFPERSLNGQKLHWREREFIAGFGSYRLGPPRLRQLRVKEAEIFIPHLGKFTSFGTYGISTEVSENYCFSWKTFTTCSPFKEVTGYSSEAWKYTNALDIWGYPMAGVFNTYGGGGYIAQLAVDLDISRNILNELYTETWIDRGTRAVLFEFTLYCANLNIFTYSVFMLEFTETGGVIPSYTILPLRIYQHMGSNGIYILACEVFYLVYFVSVGILLIYRFHTQRMEFFKSNWQIIDLVSFIIGAVAISMYFIRLVMTNLTIAKFKEDPKRFVNFQHIALWDQVFVVFISLLVFIATIRFLKILGHNYRLQRMIRLVTSAGKDLKWNCILLTYFIIVYAMMGNLIFGSRLDSYKNMYSTLGTLFISILGLTRFTELEETDPVFSRIYFLAYIFFVVYVMMTTILSILNQSMEALHTHENDEDSEELIQYFLIKFKGMFRGSQGMPDTKKNNDDGFSKIPRRHSVSCSDSLLSEVKGQVKIDMSNVMLKIRDAFRRDSNPNRTKIARNDHLETAELTMP
ncbi:hypothetical protein ACJMK2_035514 [Sinanodonta woodiana]|uniref:Polycystic kidney disease protein 1-like 2 n=1 Tax=Sinanodonta woodiana TaxID=1069815 RepID=A0ABD3WZ76_SINWO